MGKKKLSAVPHQTQSFEQMVSKAALAKMAPEIEQMVRHYTQNLGNQLAQHQASTLETLFSRVVTLERLAMEKFGLSAEDLANKISDLEDEKEGLSKVDAVELNDVVRLVVKTKTADQLDYQGESRLKLYQSGSGNTLGPELEGAIIGMKTGEVKTLSFGKDAQLVAEIKVDRISRGPKSEASDADQAQG